MLIFCWISFFVFNVNRCYYYGNYESKHHGSCTSERQNLYVMYQGLVFFIGLYRKQNRTSVYSTFICSTTIKAFLNKINQQIHGIHNFFFPTISNMFWLFQILKFLLWISMLMFWPNQGKKCFPDIMFFTHGLSSLPSLELV